MAEPTDIKVKTQESATTKRKSEAILECDSAQKPKTENPKLFCDNSSPIDDIRQEHHQIKGANAESLKKTECFSNTDIENQQKEHFSFDSLENVHNGDNNTDLKMEDPQRGDSEVENLGGEEEDDDDDEEYNEDDEDDEEPGDDQKYRSELSKEGTLGSNKGKGKGKLIEENEREESEGSDYSEEEDDVSDDDPLTEVDFANILPSRTRRGKQRGLNLH